jgi:pimeloyl-ACP methyl ester carboxylesterase
MHAAIPGARMTLIDGAAHILNAERPDQFNALLAAFLTDPARPLA